MLGVSVSFSKDLWRENKGRKLENIHILSWCRIHLLRFVRNYALTLLFSLLRNSFHYYQLPWKNWVPRAVYDCPLGWRGRYNRSRVRKFHVPGPMKFFQICQSTNFYFYPLSKVFMTVLHQNMTNGTAPQKYDKWLCSTKFCQICQSTNFYFYLLSKISF